MRREMLAIVAQRPRMWSLLCLLCAFALMLSTPAMAASKASTEPSVAFPTEVPLPLRVGVAVFVSRIEKINEVANTFVGNIDVRYRWRDPRLSFEMKEQGTDRLEFDDEAALAKLQTIWNPRISITNLVEADAQRRVGLFIYPDGSVELIQRVKATFETRFNLRAFPFDTQSLSVIMLSSKYNVNQIQLVQDQKDLDHSGINPELQLKEWEPGALVFRVSQIRAWSGIFIPQFEATVKVQRYSTIILLGVFTPLLLLMAVPTIIAHLNKADVVARLNAWATSILALVALSFTWALRFPALESDNLISQIIATGYIYQLVSVLLAVTIYNEPVAKRLGNQVIVEELARYLRWAVPLIFLGSLLTGVLLRAYSW